MKFWLLVALVVMSTSSESWPLPSLTGSSSDTLQFEMLRNSTSVLAFVLNSGLLMAAADGKTVTTVKFGTFPTDF